MRKTVLVSLSAMALLASAGMAAATHNGSASDNMCNGSCADKGNKNGWVDHTSGSGHDIGRVPKGLTVSGENGRVDNGQGNGGENPTGATPNLNGEDGQGDADPN